MEILGEDRFRINSYRTVARVIGGAADRRGGPAGQRRTGRDARNRQVDAGQDRGVRQDRRITAHQELLAKIPPTLLELLGIPGVGPKTRQDVLSRAAHREHRGSEAGPGRGPGRDAAGIRAEEGGRHPQRHRVPGEGHRPHSPRSGDGRRRYRRRFLAADCPASTRSSRPARSAAGPRPSATWISSPRRATRARAAQTPGADHRVVHEGPVRRADSGRRRDQGLRSHPHGHDARSGRCTGGAAGELRGRLAVFHRLQGPQRPSAGDRREGQAQAQRVRPVQGR